MRRVSASLIDTFLIVFSIVYLTGTIPSLALYIKLPLLFLGAATYFTCLPARRGKHNGQTIGKQILGIRVRRDDGKALGISFNLYRYLVFTLLRSLPVIGLFDVTYPLIESERRTLHDIVVSTRVVIS